MIQFMIQKVHVRAAMLAFFMLLSATLTFSQQKERNRRLEAAQNNPPAASTPSAKDDKDDKNEGDPLFRGMKYRSIGPFRGGRSLTAAGIPGDPTTYYFGATGGGVWKSTDGADTWSPVFDKDGAPSIGSIAVAVSDPNIVYVGTGEACIRGNISHGDGVWKSVDAGKSWKSVGLKDSRAIGKVIVNPRNPDIVFVAALGHPYGPKHGTRRFPHHRRRQDLGQSSLQRREHGRDRCGFRSAESQHLICRALGGATDIHGRSRAVGRAAACIVQPMAAPPGNGLENTGFRRVPTGESAWRWRRIPSASTRLSRRKENGGLYRSDDGGDTWDLVNGSHSLFQRAVVLHARHRRSAGCQYGSTSLDVEFFKSTDGGRNFNKMKVPHGDNHGLWIDPQNTRRMIASNDGGVTVSLDGGNSWTREDNQPTAQFYHVITDTPTSLITSTARSRIIPPWRLPAAAIAARLAATIGTPSGAGKQATSLPIQPTRTSCMPATIRATSRASTGARTRSKTSPCCRN